MVWKATSRVGVAIAIDGQKVIIVAKYREAGNFIGRYDQNVLPRSGNISAVSQSYTSTTVQEVAGSTSIPSGHLRPVPA